MKKYPFIFLMIVLFLSITVVSAKSINYSGIDYENFNELKKTLCPHANEYSNIIYPNIGYIDDEEVLPYCEFENQDEALNSIVRRFPEVFEYLKNKYNLENISDENWQIYNAHTHGDDNLSFSIPYAYINAFFDVYENKYINNELKELINIHNNITYNESLERLSSDVETKILGLLPDYNDVSFNTFNSNSEPFRTQSFNRAYGYAYAIYYAVNPNTYDYEVVEYDCTNFASQILHYGGYNLEWGLPSSGWWYTNTLGWHYANAWTNAGYFTNHWGIYYYTTNFYSFSTNVKAGDFIALDEDNDGGYNHMGFVVELSDNYHWNNFKIYVNDAGGWETSGYVSFRDFKVAQHSYIYHTAGFYNLYVSDDGNGWELYDLIGSRYGIVDIDQ